MSYLNPTILNEYNTPEKVNNKSVIELNKAYINQAYENVKVIKLKEEIIGVLKVNIKKLIIDEIQNFSNRNNVVNENNSNIEEIEKLRMDLICKDNIIENLTKTINYLVTKLNEAEIQPEINTSEIETINKTANSSISITPNFTPIKSTINETVDCSSKITPKITPEKSKEKYPLKNMNVNDL